MACPLITGKGYSFSDPVIERGTVGASVRAAVEFTIFPQEGYFLRADHFYVNSSSDFISQVQFIQNGNNVNVIATLDVDTWPGENTALDLDIEYNYLPDLPDGTPSTGLDPIVRVQTVRILPINDANITTMFEGMVVPPEGVEHTITGICGETVDLPVVNVSPGPGLTILQGEDSVEIDVSDPKLDLTSRTFGNDILLDSQYTFDETDTEALTDDEGNLVDEDGNAVSQEDAIPVDADGVEITIEGIDVMLGIPFEDIVEDDLLEPEPTLEVSFPEAREPLLGGPFAATVTGVPNIGIAWSLDPGDCTLPPETVSGEDADGCAINIEQAQPTSGTITLDASGNGTIEFTAGLETECCTYTLTVEDTVNQLTNTATVEQCDETVFQICLEARTEDIPDTVFPELPQVVYTSTTAPGNSMADYGTFTTTIPKAGGQWLLQAPAINPESIECWINGHPTDYFDCFNAEASIVGNDLRIDWVLQDGIQPEDDVKLILDLDCFAEDPIRDPLRSTLEFCVNVVGSPSQITVGGPFRIEGDQLSTVPDFRYNFDLTLEDGYIWSDLLADVNIGGPGVSPVPVPLSTQTFANPSTESLTGVSAQVRRFSFETITTSVFSTDDVKVTYEIELNIEEYVPPTPPVEIPGCTDSTATNYNPDATEDDGSCVYPPPPPVPQFSCTVNIINNVPNTGFADGIEATQVFGPHNTGTTFDGMFDIESVDGYDPLDFSTVTVVQDPVQLTINGTSFFGIQTVGDSEITITLTGVGPTETPPEVILEPLTCPLDNLTVEVGDDGALTGTLNEGILLELLPATVPLDGNEHRVNYRMEVPDGYSNTGDTLECGGPLVQTEVPVPGMVSACVRSFDLFSGDQLVTSNYVRLYTEEILTTFETDLEQFRVDDGQPFLIPAEDNIEDFYLFAVLNTDAYQGQLGTRFTSNATVQDAEDQDGNQINNGRQSLPASFFPAFRGLDGVFTSDGFASSGITIALRWQQTDTNGPSKVYFDIDINVDELNPIPQPGNILINVIKHPDSLWTPVEYGVDGTIFDDPNNGFQIEISGLSGQLGSSNNERVYFGLLNDQPRFYGPGEWDTEILAPLSTDYWTDQGYSINGSVTDFIFADTVYTKMEFVSYTTGDGTVVTDDPYPNIGIGARIDETAKTIEQVSSQFVRFRNFPVQGYHGSVDGDTGISLAHRCDDRSQAFVTTATSVFSSASRLDPRGGTAIYNMYIDPPVDPPVQQNGTILYTDESSEWEGSTVDNTTVDLENYDWGTRDVGNDLEAQDFVFTTDRGYPAIESVDDFDFTIIERSWVDECNVNNVGPRDAAESNISVVPSFDPNRGIYGDRGSITLTVGGTDDDVQLSNRDVVLDLNIEGDNDMLREATFEVKLIDNFRNGTTSEAATYDGFETEWYPDNTPFVVSAIPDDGYAFQDDTVTSVTISTEGSSGPNLDIFANGNITATDITTIPGTLLVTVQPDSEQVLAPGHTVLCLIADGVPTGPPWEEEDDLLTRQAVFAPVTDDVGNFTVTAEPAVSGASVSATVQLTDFNVANSNDENNESYTVTLIPADTFSFNPLTLSLVTLGTFKDVDGTDPTDNFSTSNLRLADDGRSVQFDCEFTFTSIPDPDPILVFLDVPEGSIITDDFVQVQFEVDNNVTNATLVDDTPVLHGGLQPGDTVTAEFTIRPNLYFNLETAPTATLDQSEISFDSTATVVTGPLTDYDRGVFQPQQATYTVSYTVSTDDFVQIQALSDNTYNIGIALAGAVVPVEATTTFRTVAHANAVSDVNEITFTNDAGQGIPGYTYNSQWVLPTGGLHWYRGGLAITNDSKIRHVSGENYIGSGNRSLTSTPTVVDDYKTMDGVLTVTTGPILPEGAHTYEVFLDTTPADDTITSLTCAPTTDIPSGGDDVGRTYTFTISNETSSGVDLTSTNAVQDETGVTVAAVNHTHNRYRITFPSTTAYDEEDVLGWTTNVTTEFGSTSSKDLVQEIVPEDERISTRLRVIYDLTGRPSNVDVIDSDGMAPVSDIHIVEYNRGPGRLDSNQISVSTVGSLLNFAPTNPYLVWSSNPEEAGELTFTAPNEDTYNGSRKIWSIPNTGRRANPSFAIRGLLRQDPFDATISDSITVQNTHTYDYHPNANTDITVTVAGTGPSQPPFTYNCDQLISFTQPAPQNDMSYSLIYVDISQLFASDDGTLVSNTDLGTTDWWVGADSIGRVQMDQNYRVQVMYGNPGLGLNRLGIFTDSRWIGRDLDYQGIFTTSPTTADPSGQQIYDIPGFYGYGFGSSDIDTFVLGSGIGTLRATFNPNIMGHNGNDDIDITVAGIGNFVNVPGGFTSQWVANGINLNSAISWYNSLGVGNPPQYFIIRVLGGISGSGVDGNSTAYPLDIGLNTGCLQSSTAPGRFGPRTAQGSANSVANRASPLWTLNQDTTLL